MKTLLHISVLLIGLVAFSQPGGERMKERIKAQKATFITNALDLTTEEAQKFWPIYNTYDDTSEKIRRKDLRNIKQKMRQNPNMSDAEANDMLKDLIDAETRLFQSKIQLLNDLKGVIPANKIIKLKAAEDEFNRKLLDRLKEFRNKRPRGKD